jgi:glycerol-3-phosphate acyltransferase PlsY
MPMLFLAVGYLAGSIPFGLVITRLFTDKDVRLQGSGNIGATNVSRVAGKKLGAVVLILDALKGALPVLGVMYVQPEAYALHAGVGYAAFLGHVFPVWLRFKGGKGVATALGAVLAYHPAMVLPAFGVFLATLLVSRYVSLGSVLAAAALFLTALGLAGAWAIVPTPEPRWPALLAWALLSGLVILKHRANLERLFRGTESLFWGAKHD